MSRKQVHYFCEGYTERNLLRFLKDTKQIQSGPVKIHNLWDRKFKLIRTVKKTDKLLFVVDTDKINNKSIFLENIELLKSYNVCLIVQNKDLEDELCFACDKVKKLFLFKSFYKVKSKKEFKSRFNKDDNLRHTLSKNNFNFNSLWVRSDDFSNWLKNNHVEIYICREYKSNCVNP
jgi:hypothetical protein